MRGWSGKDLARVTGKFTAVVELVTTALKAEGHDPTDVARNFYLTSWRKRT
jgi:hypothetical protein